MRIKCLLINPWIYDFAAYNFWARPLGLLKVAEFLSLFNVELFFIDCCDSFRIKKYGAGKYMAEIIEKPQILKNIPRNYRRYGISKNEFIEKLRQVRKIDFILITSIMAYWWYGVKEVVDIVREYFNNVPVILGGIYATLYKEHADKKTGVDYIYTGQIGDRFIKELERVDLSLEKIKEKPQYWWRMGFYRDMPYAPILTSSGCPFRCSYCASAALNENFKQRPVDEVLEEIEGLYNIGVRNFAFYDDALLYRADIHIKPLLKRIIKKNWQINFHTPNGLHARFIDEKVAWLMKQVGFKTLRLSLETVNIKRQIETGGKVTNEELERAVFYLKKAGFLSQEVGVYIMYGLLGQSIDEVWEGVNFLKKLKVRIHLTEFSPIRGTCYWQELVNKGVISDDIDPLLTNNSIFPELFTGYSRHDIEQLKTEVNRFNMIL